MYRFCKIIILAIFAISFVKVGNCANIFEEIDEPCTTDIQCQAGISGPLSRCNGTVCVCTDNAVIEPGETPKLCRLKRDMVGEPCERNSQCKANMGALAECEGGTCICNIEHGVPSASNRSCLLKVNHLGGGCTEKAQCTAGTPGEFSDCLGDICSCTTQSIQLPGQNKCFKLAVGVGDTCDHLEQCKLGKPGNYSRCDATTKMCACEGTALDVGGQCLVIVNKIGEPCTDTNQCTNGQPGQHSVCRPASANDRQPICQCQNTAVQQPGTEICLMKAVAIGGPCQINLQCTANIGNLSTCGINRNCSCVAGAIGNRDGVPNTRCYPAGILMGNRCNDSAQCGREPSLNAVCSTNACGCTATHTPNNALDACLEIKNMLQDNCTENQQCQRGIPGPLSTCQGGNCQCSTEAIPDGHTCFRKAVNVGDACARDIQCTTNLGPAFCIPGIQHCDCNPNAVASSTGTRCLMKMPLGQTCEEDGQCAHVSQAVCRQVNETRLECQCNTEMGYIPNPNNQQVQCMKLAQTIGEACHEHPTQCGFLEGTHCNRTTLTCECQVDTPVASPDGRVCYRLVDSLNLDCNVTEQCQVGNSECRLIEQDNKCVCRDGFVEGEIATNTCLQVRGELEQECMENVQCHGIGINATARCLDGQCKCPATNPPSEFFNEQCVTPRRLDELCETDNECHLGICNNQSVCNTAGCDPIEMKCACLTTAIRFEQKCYESKNVGDSCENTLECVLSMGKYVLCSNSTGPGLCACEAGYESREGICNRSGGVRIEISFFCVFLSTILLRFTWQ